LRVANSAIAINSYGQYGVNNTYAVRNVEASGSVYNAKQTEYSVMGLIVPGKMRGAGHGLSEAGRNIQGKISAAQSDEDKLQKAQNALQRMRELAAASSDATGSNIDRVELDLEYTQYKFELSKICTLRLNGIDPDKSQTSVVPADQPDTGATAEGIISALYGDGLGDIKTAAAAKAAAASVDSAISEVSAERERLGAVLDGLEKSIQSLGAPPESKKSTGSGKSGAGTTRSMIDNIKKSMLSRSAAASLAQANIMPQGVLQLIN